MMFAKRSAPNGQGPQPGRQDGEADVVEVVSTPQADGDSAVKPGEVVQPAETPASKGDNRATGWRGR